MRIYLIGFMCSGKTTIGKLLSEKLKFEFIDIDEEIRKSEGMSIPEIFEKKGENFFRKKEFETLKKISEKDNIVISTGGGLGANKKALNFMKKKGKVIWININFQTFLKRCSESTDRPLLKKSLEELKELFEKRKEIYEEADIKVNGEKKPEEVVREIILSLKGNSP